jgi:hypothetical protein
VPLKYVFIKDKTTGEYLSREEALKLIDDRLKVCVDLFIGYAIELVTDRYEIEVFATREKCEGRGFSQVTMDELFTLCREAPFDIGYDNIFWDTNGDAVIIDTEYKGSSVSDCEKLNRYPVIEQK